MSTIRLDGRVAIVTGATQGIGRAVSLDLASRGVQVVGSARNPEPAAALAQEAARLGGGFTFVQADVSRWSECERIAQAAIDAFGRIDILVNNAGISRPHARMDQIDEETWRAVSGSTLEGTIAMTRYVLPTMREQKRGVIINIASAAAVSGLASMGAYCMAKTAVMHHAKVVAIENMEFGIRCNALVVGAVETEAMKKSLLSQAQKVRGADWTPEEGEKAAHSSSLTMQPEDLARAITLLCLDEAREINGGAIAIDRGFSAGMYNSKFNQYSAAGLLPKE